MAIEHDLLVMYADPALVTKPALLEERGGAYYSEAAAQLVSSLVNDTGDVQVVDVRNDGTIVGLPDDTVVEVPCVIDSEGAQESARVFQSEFDASLLASVNPCDRLRVIHLLCFLSGSKTKARGRACSSAGREVL